MVANLGRLDVLRKSGLENIVYDLLNYVSPDKKKKFKDITKMEKKCRYNYRFVAYAKLWQILEMLRILREITKDKKIEFNFIKTLFSLVFA